MGHKNLVQGQQWGLVWASTGSLLKLPYCLLYPWRLNIDLLTELHIGTQLRVFTCVHTWTHIYFIDGGLCQAEKELSQAAATQMYQ